MTAKRKPVPAHRRTAAEVVKENPIKTAASIVAALGIIVGAVVTVDDRYAHAGEVRQSVQQFSTGLTVNRLTNEVGQLRIERALLQQRIIELQKAGPRARADLQRAATDLAALDAELLAKKRQLDRVLAGGK